MHHYRLGSHRRGSQAERALLTARAAFQPKLAPGQGYNSLRDRFGYMAELRFSLPFGEQGLGSEIRGDRGS